MMKQMAPLSGNVTKRQEFLGPAVIKPEINGNKSREAGDYSLHTNKSMEWIAWELTILR